MSRHGLVPSGDADCTYYYDCYKHDEVIEPERIQCDQEEYFDGVLKECTHCNRRSMEECCRGEQTCK